MMENEKNEYDTQAEKFLSDTNTEFKAEFVKHGKHFEDDKEDRDIYEITLKRGGREFKFMFGCSLNDSGVRLFGHDGKRTKHKMFSYPQELRHSTPLIKPTRKEQILKQKFMRWFENEHFKLSGLTYDFGEPPTAYSVLTCLQKNDVGSFKEFCGDFGYSDDSIKADKIYKAVCTEWMNIQALYNDVEIEQLQEIQ